MTDKSYFFVTDETLIDVIEKIQRGELSDIKDTKLVIEILKNYHEIMNGLATGKIRGKDLEKQIKDLIRKNEKANPSHKGKSQDNQNENNSTENDNSAPGAGKKTSDDAAPQHPMDDEKKKNEDDSKAENKNENSTTKPNNRKKKEKKGKRGGKRKNEGRNSHKDFKNIDQIRHAFPESKDNFKCPCCNEVGRISFLKPSVNIFFSGQPPVVPEAHVSEKVRCHECGSTYGAQLPIEVENSVGRFLPSALSSIINKRYCFGEPNYRLETFLQYYNFSLPDSSQLMAIELVVDDLEPLYDAFVQAASNAEWLGHDDAFARVDSLRQEIKEELKNNPKNEVRTGIQTSVFVAKTFTGQIIQLFMTGRNHQGENKNYILEQRTNPESIIMMSDAAAKAKIKGPKNCKTIDTHCLEHARIKFEEIKEYFPELSVHFLGEVKKIYINDAHCKKSNFDNLARLAYHQSNSKIIMESLETWISNQLESNLDAEPNGKLASVLKYCKKHWVYFSAFLVYPGAQLDNNCTERGTKTPVRHRNNSRKYSTERGAFMGDMFMTFITSAILNNYNPIEYIEFLITHRKLVVEDPVSFLPWNYKETETDILEEMKNRPKFIKLERTPSSKSNEVAQVYM